MKEIGKEQLLSNKIAILNYMATVVILIYHSEIRYLVNGIDMLCYIAMHFFFMTSGFFLLRGSENLFLQINRVKKRIFTLLVPYFLWNFIYYILLYAPDRVNFVNDSSILSRAYEVIKNILMGTYCLPSWYLTSLFGFAILSVGLIYTYKYKSLTIGMIILGLLINYIANYKGQAFFALYGFWGMTFIRTGRYVASFLIGGAFGYWIKEKKELPKWTFVFGILTFVFSVWYMINTDPYNPILVILEELSVFLIWFSLPSNIFRPTKAIKFISAPSFFIIMSHNLCYKYLDLVMNKLYLFQNLSGKKYGMVKVCASIVILSGLYYLLNAFAKPVLSVLCGGRVVSKAKQP